jgi:hypothetical protein
LGELDLIVPVPKGTRGKELTIVILKKKLSVGLKGKEKILDGELCKEIKVEESTWTLGECPRSDIPLFSSIVQKIKRLFIFISRSSINNNGGRMY